MFKNKSTYSSKLWIFNSIIAVLFAICIVGQFIQPLSGKNVTKGSGSDNARVAKFNISASELTKTDLEIAQGTTDTTKITVYNQETETATQYYVEVTFPDGAELPSDVTMNITYIDSAGSDKTAVWVQEDGKYVFRSDDWVFNPASLETFNQKDLNLNFSLSASKFQSADLLNANEEFNNIDICVYCYQID